MEGFLMSLLNAYQAGGLFMHFILLVGFIAAGIVVERALALYKNYRQAPADLRTKLLTFISLGLIISNFDSLLISFPMWIFISILWSYGIFTAIKGETKPMPLLGTYFQKWLSNIS